MDKYSANPNSDYEEKNLNQDGQDKPSLGDKVSGNWKIFKGEIKRQWGELTDDQIDQIEGSREKLCGYIQKTYGVKKEEAVSQVENFEKRHNQSFLN
ncbi:MAG: CsbD family protein [Alphaproteobacteria bacterium]|nr:CsbD family protein [Alphaproteobacteria bacterium]